MHEHRYRARDAVGTNGQEAIKGKIREWWKDMSADEKGPYHQKAREDQKRFDKQMAAELKKKKSRG